MSNIKRITDLSAYKSVLPYASELFGVYHSLIGWNSKWKQDRIKKNTENDHKSLFSRLSPYLEDEITIDFNDDCTVSAPNLGPAGFAGPKLIPQDSIVLQQISQILQDFGEIPVTEDAWQRLVNSDLLSEILRTKVLEHYNEISISCCEQNEIVPIEETTDTEDFVLPFEKLQHCKEEVRNGITNEAKIAGVIKELVANGRVNELNNIFFDKMAIDSKHSFLQALNRKDIDFKDPYLTFDPKKDVTDATLSPLGMVHLFRQYFFELDTFLGTPTGHVWLSPGSTVELIEVSTRKTTTERTIETLIEKTKKIETAKTTQDEISEAVKEENKEDLKLGFTTTVNQSWGTGDASATASLNMDKTQELSRETTHKRMRTQSEKLSSEIRENYKTTFKTVTEVTDTSSKRHILANNTEKLINYELRRKMRQVGVQVQDVGTYLCWETFVDNPGKDLGLADLVHYAQPTDLVQVPDQTEIPIPPDQPIPCKAMNVTWNFGKTRMYDFVTLTTFDVPPPPEGYEVVVEKDIIPAVQISATGKDFTQVWRFGAKFKDKAQLEIGVITGPQGLSWDNRVDFAVGFTLKYTPTQAKRKEIENANLEKKRAGETANREYMRKSKEAFYKAVKERIEFARDIHKRKFEDLREEERIIIYRQLISSLLTNDQYIQATDSSRHVLSELINSIFDIDKMLYFVAPEWWKPRMYKRDFDVQDIKKQLNDNLITWSDSEWRSDNYLITEKSSPAPMGSSLGWLLQLDGDNLRNAFLNAPWVKAVIPIRPGKEQAALHWLQNTNIEGIDGLNAEYMASEDELNQIKTKLELGSAEKVTIKKAIDFLCIQVAEKHEESNKVKAFPETEVNDDNKVTSTPVEKVFEHGFYPLQGGFRVDPSDPNQDPNNKDKNFQVFDQWIEVLPTDQVVPVEVTYNPITGRQIPVENASAYNSQAPVESEAETVEPRVMEINIDNIITDIEN
ncbi:peptidoglycan-binding protein [Bacillus bingmayongensis]|uniref:peptidoglycan-binding protein n=1 Tax=Bacillus bingmayongensis TaxID=1150157 RepID=UPI001C8D4D40|nr:peptidoglycan-binding protein [Bacillus bingmayongensis]MBY0598960.1 peptidoglycan-binding protein [Bacillus bingmayongensis]